MRIYLKKRLALALVPGFVPDIRSLTYIYTGKGYDAEGYIHNAEGYIHNAEGYIHNAASDLIQLDQKLYKILSSPSVEVKTMLGAWPVTLDKREYTRGEEVYQVPPRAQVEQLTQYVYRLTPESLAEYREEYTASDHTLKYNYLSLPPEIKDIHQPEIKAELLQWLSFKL